MRNFLTDISRRLVHTFGNLYNVVKFVDRSDFPRDYKTKKFYTNLIRAQLSRDELGLLFYNCLSDRGAKFKKLVEKYALLKYLPFEVLMNKKHRDTLRRKVPIRKRSKYT